MVTSRIFKNHGLPLDMVRSFRYLGRVTLATDDDWTEVVQNMAKASRV